MGATIALPAGAQEVQPRPAEPFKGRIGRTVKDSKPDFPKEVQAPKEAPNILLIMTDDVGFGALEITPVMVYFLYHVCI